MTAVELAGESSGAWTGAGAIVVAHPASAKAKAALTMGRIMILSSVDGSGFLHKTPRAGSSYGGPGKGRRSAYATAIAPRPRMGGRGGGSRSPEARAR